LKSDSTFAQAYTGLAWVYWDKHYWETFFSEDFMDSVLILVNIALSYDDQLSEAYAIRGSYYHQTGKSEMAIEEYNKASNLNPNDWMAYFGKGGLYSLNDIVMSIDNFQKAASLNRGEQLPVILRQIGNQFSGAGFSEESYYYWKEALNLDGDSSKYYYCLWGDEFNHGNFEKAIKYITKAYSLDTTVYQMDSFFNLAYTHLFLGNYNESLKYINKHIERLKAIGATEISGMWIIGYIYWKNGYKEKAEYFFDRTIKNSYRMIDLGRAYAQNLSVYYDLAAIYAFRGDTDKAYKNLRIYNQQQTENLGMVTTIKNDPLFDNIRDEPEFQQIVRDVEAKYQAEHERVRKWLEEQGEL
jgi:tetratricopeptide (TPR) repeat protein